MTSGWLKRRNLRACLAVACFVALSAGRAGQAQEGTSTVVFYDPDANYEAVPRIVKSVNDHFAERLPGMKLQATNDVAGMLDVIRKSRAEFAIVGSEYLDSVKGLGATPLLVLESGGSVYYRKLLVDLGTGTAGDLRGKRIAASAGDRSRNVSGRTLTLLSSAGIQVDNALFLPVSKDFDALLALTFGQADAALVTALSLDTLKAVNPGAAARMRSVWTSGKILRPVLVSLGSQEAQPPRDSVVKCMEDMATTGPGRGAMQAMGVDKWTRFTADMTKRAARD